MRITLALLSLGLTLPGCRPSRPAVSTTDSTEAARHILPDSMVLRMKDGAEIWLAAGRPDTSAAGAVCLERLFEVRTSGRVIPVPLLYSMGPPEVVNDSTVRAALTRHCVPSAWYLVNTRSGQPVPDKR
ncbi:MAG: hypothetical protein ABI679_04800 [Gemmatimonadota bacterium]